MKKILLTFLLASFVIIGCSSGSDDDTSFNTVTNCGDYNGHTLHKGPKGGCYYINSSGNKEYVERSLCDC